MRTYMLNKLNFVEKTVKEIKNSYSDKLKDWEREDIDLLIDLLTIAKDFVNLVESEEDLDLIIERTRGIHIDSDEILDKLKGYKDSEKEIDELVAKIRAIPEYWFTEEELADVENYQNGNEDLTDFNEEEKTKELLALIEKERTRRLETMKEYHVSFESGKRKKDRTMIAIVEKIIKAESRNYNLRPRKFTYDYLSKTIDPLLKYVSDDNAEWIPLLSREMNYEIVMRHVARSFSLLTY